jgi:poly-gamma-glutamate capsule biosynthesis protein CapA/YwtB (metallophosphatase superfamily)
MKVFLCGDVMIGRGIDQILPYPCDPKIYEPFVKDARDYVRFAEEINGKIDYPVSFDYIWGDALKEIEKEKVDLRIINLETTITTSENFEPKGINYRMNPKNIDVLKVFKVNVACLANNHILDFGQEGLLETIDILNKNGILTVGAGKNIEEAEKPAIIWGRATSPILIFSYADVSSGVPIWWKAEKDKAGVNLLTSDIPKLEHRENELIVFSIHWGPNWGYEITKEQRNFAHRLIDEANVDLIFGHSSHHFKGIETYKGKFIIYGAGDFINDYEGIEGYKEFRGDLVLGYIWEIDKLTLLPFKIKKFRLNYCIQVEIDWIYNVLKRESKIEGDFILEEKRIIIKL